MAENDIKDLYEKINRIAISVEKINSKLDGINDNIRLQISEHKEECRTCGELVRRSEFSELFSAELDKKRGRFVGIIEAVKAAAWVIGAVIAAQALKGSL